MSDPMEKPPRRDETTRGWIQALGITLSVILGVLGVLGVIALALVGLVFWTCSRH